MTTTYIDNTGSTRVLGLAVSGDGKTVISSTINGYLYMFKLNSINQWVKYNIYTNSNVQFVGCALTSNGTRGIVVTNPFSLDQRAWQSQTNYINGRCYWFDVSINNIILNKTSDTFIREYSGVDTTFDGSRIVTCTLAINASNSVYYADWNGNNYNEFTKIEVTYLPMRYIGVAISNDKTTIAYSEESFNVYYVSLDLTQGTYGNKVNIPNNFTSNQVDVRSLRFVNNTNQLILGVSCPVVSNNFLYSSTWNASNNKYGDFISYLSYPTGTDNTLNIWGISISASNTIFYSSYGSTDSRIKMVTTSIPINNGYTNFIVNNSNYQNRDLSTIFKQYVSGGYYMQETGYTVKVRSDLIFDLSRMFQKYTVTNSPKPQPTGFCIRNNDGTNIDLADVFESVGTFFKFSGEDLPVIKQITLSDNSKWYVLIFTKVGEYNFYPTYRINIKHIFTVDGGTGGQASGVIIPGLGGKGGDIKYINNTIQDISNATNYITQFTKCNVIVGIGGRGGDSGSLSPGNSGDPSSIDISNTTLIFNSVTNNPYMDGVQNIITGKYYGGSGGVGGKGRDNNNNNHTGSNGGKGGGGGGGGGGSGEAADGGKGGNSIDDVGYNLFNGYDGSINSGEGDGGKGGRDNYNSLTPITSSSGKNGYNLDTNTFSGDGGGAGTTYAPYLQAGGGGGGGGGGGTGGGGGGGGASSSSDIYTTHARGGGGGSGTVIMVFTI
jgi:hypothetical protein